VHLVVIVIPYIAMSSNNISKIKVGRLWGYPIIVTTGKSKHEAIYFSIAMMIIHNYSYKTM